MADISTMFDDIPAAGAAPAPAAADPIATMFDDIPGPQPEEDKSVWGGAFGRGFNRLQQFANIGLNLAGLSSDADTAAALLRDQADALQYPEAPSYKAAAKQMEEAGSREGILNQLGGMTWTAISNPQYMISVAAESLPASLVASVAASPGALAKSPVLSGTGAGAASFATEYTASILETMQARGVDLSDADATAKALADPKLMAEAKSRAWKRGLPIAAFDAISMGVGGRIAKLFGANKLLGEGAEIAVQGALGGFGEAGAGVASGEGVDPSATFMETAAEFVTSIPDIILGRFGMRGGGRRTAPPGTPPGTPGTPPANVPPGALPADQVMPTPEEEGVSVDFVPPSFPETGAALTVMSDDDWNGLKVATIKAGDTQTLVEAADGQRRLINNNLLRPVADVTKEVAADAAKSAIADAGQGGDDDKRPDSPRLTPADRTSPIPNDIIDDGKALVEAATGKESTYTTTTEIDGKLTVVEGKVSDLVAENQATTNALIDRITATVDQPELFAAGTEGAPPASETPVGGAVAPAEAPVPVRPAVAGAEAQAWLADQGFTPEQADALPAEEQAQLRSEFEARNEPAPEPAGPRDFSNMAHPRSEDTKDFKDWVGKVKEFGKARAAYAADLVANSGGKGIRMVSKTNPNRKALVGPDMTADDAGKFRVTRIDEHGPSGHMVYNTFEEATEEAIKDGYVPTQPTGPAAQEALKTRMELNRVAKVETPAMRPKVETRPVKDDVAITPAGRDVPVQYAVVEADDLIASQRDEGGANPAYPQELQPRDRSRAMSDAQIANIANNLDPRLLDQNPNASDGAPIISDDGVVESGNGRVLAIRKAFNEDLPTASVYRDYLEQQGYPVDGMKRPVLVRVRQGEMQAQDRTAFTREANERTTLKLSEPEQAMADAAAITPQVLSLYQGGDVQSAANADFVRSFQQQVVNRNEQAVTTTGKLATEGVRRIRNALLARAYGDADLVSGLTENPDDNIKAIGGALMDVAGDWAQMSSEVAEGKIAQDVDITPFVLEATRMIQRARTEGRPLAEYVAQSDVFSGTTMSPEAEMVLKLMFRNHVGWTQPVGREKLAEALRFYAEEVRKTKPGVDMFGDKPPTSHAILKEALSRQYAKEREAAAQKQSGNDRGAGKDDGTHGGKRAVQAKPGQAAKDRAAVQRKDAAKKSKLAARVAAKRAEKQAALRGKLPDEFQLKGRVGDFAFGYMPGKNGGRNNWQVIRKSTGAVVLGNLENHSAAAVAAQRSHKAEENAPARDAARQAALSPAEAVKIEHLESEYQRLQGIASSEQQRFAHSARPDANRLFEVIQAAEKARKAWMDAKRESEGVVAPKFKIDSRNDTSEPKPPLWPRKLAKQLVKRLYTSQMIAAIKAMNAIPATNEAPTKPDGTPNPNYTGKYEKFGAYGTDEWWAKRVYNLGKGGKTGNKAAAVDYLYGVATGLATEELNAERAKEGLPPLPTHKVAKKKIAIILQGVPAAGKSSIANPLAYEYEAAITDVDEAKKVIPEYVGKDPLGNMTPGIGASAVHVESGEIQNDVTTRLIEEGSNIVIPTVGHNVGGMAWWRRTLESKGYTIHVVQMKIDPITAVGRMIARFRATGRLINPKYLMDVIRLPPLVFAAVRDRNFFNGSYTIIETKDNEPARVTETSGEAQILALGDRIERTGEIRPGGTTDASGDVQYSQPSSGGVTPAAPATGPPVLPKTATRQEVTQYDNATASYYTTDYFAKYADAILKDLRKILDSYGLKDINLKVWEKILVKQGHDTFTPAGAQVEDLIHVALTMGSGSATDPYETLHHEVVHALLAHAASIAERSILFAKSQRDWITDHIKANYAEEDWAEEGIAFAFTKWLKGEEMKPTINRIFGKFSTFLKAIYQSLTGHDIRNANDVFRQMKSGKMGSRTQKYAGKEITVQERPDPAAAPSKPYTKAKEYAGKEITAIPKEPAYSRPKFDRGPGATAADINYFGDEFRGVLDKADAALSPKLQDVITGFTGRLPGGEKIGRGDMDPSRLEAIAKGEDPVGAAALKKAFAPVREALRQKYGDTVTLYRSQRAVAQGASRVTLSWSANKALAEGYVPKHKDGTAQGKVIYEAKVPLDQILWFTERADEAEGILANRPGDAIYVPPDGNIQGGKVIAKLTAEQVTALAAKLNAPTQAKATEAFAPPPLPKFSKPQSSVALPDGRTATIEHPDPETFNATVDGRRIGQMNLTLKRSAPYATSMSSDLRKQGVMAALHDAAERVLGRRLIPSPMGLSDDAIAFWKNRLGKMEPEEKQALLAEMVKVGEEAGVAKSSRERADRLGYRGGSPKFSKPQGGLFKEETVDLFGGQKGQQSIIPGAEQITQAQLAQRRADAPMRSTRSQQDTDALPLFSDGKKQMDLMFHRPPGAGSNATPPPPPPMNQPPHNAAQAQAALQGFLARGQPIDRAIRIPFSLLGGLDKAGRWTASKRLSDRYGITPQRAAQRREGASIGGIVGAGVGTILAGPGAGSVAGFIAGGTVGAYILGGPAWTSNGSLRWFRSFAENAKRGLITNYGLDPEYIETFRKSDLWKNAKLREGAEHLKVLHNAGVGPKEAQVIQQILSGEPVNDADMSRLALPIRQAIDDMGAEAVSYGLISAESFERNRGAYLHRVYLKNEADQSTLQGWVAKKMSSKRKRIIGDELKGRGMFMEQPAARIMQDVDSFKSGARGTPVLGEKFKILDEVSSTPNLTPGGQPTEKTLRRVYLPANEAIPAKYQGPNWKDQGTWEVRKEGAKTTLWRDYSKAERSKMGEIIDARYTIAKTFMLLAHDLATGKFYHDIAFNAEWTRGVQPPEGTWKEGGEYNVMNGRYWEDPDIQWVKVPDTNIDKTGGKKRWGALAGKWVRAEIWRDINELNLSQNPGTWRVIYRQWKSNHTYRHPVVHMNNIMSNVLFMDMADVRGQDLAGGIKSYLSGDKNYQEARDNGAFGADPVSQEIRDKVLKPILDEITKQSTGAANPYLAKIGMAGVVADKLWTWAKAADNGMMRAYQAEDEMYRMALYMRRRSQGESPEAAAAQAREQFLNYDIRAPWVVALRNTALPFIGYTYRAVPQIMNSLQLRPWKVAKYAAVAYAVNAMSYMLDDWGGGDDGEEKERAGLRDEEQGNTWLGIPRMVRMPWRDSHGLPVFFDMRRWIPAGDVMDATQGSSALPIPAPLQFGGPMQLAYEFMLNKKAFDGKEITEDLTQTPGEKLAAVADWAWKAWTPPAFWNPGSHYWSKISKAYYGAKDTAGNVYSLPEAALSAVGIKVKAVDVEDGINWHYRDFIKVQTALKYQLRSNARDLDRGIISQEAHDAKAARIMDKFGELEKNVEAFDKRVEGKKRAQ